MSEFYAGVAATASALLVKFGAAGTLTRNTPGAYDTATGTAAPSAASESIVAALFPYGDKLIDGTLIQAKDRKALISASAATEPQAGDFLTWGGETLTVVRSKVLAPARIKCIYECQLRA